MNNALPRRRSAGIIIYLLLLLLAITTADNNDTSTHDWNEKDLQSKVRHGDITTYELGSSNYEILNPEDEPEFITEDHPNYSELLKRLTSSSSAVDTIDMGRPSANANGETETETETETENPIDITTTTEAATEKPIIKWEKFEKRSYEQTSEEATNDIHQFVINKQIRHPKILVYTAAKPFQNRVSNLN